ncbi:MAG TPA: hypothetical protein VF502_00375, partial [Stellaceae bacterium]
MICVKAVRACCEDSELSQSWGNHAVVWPGAIFPHLRRVQCRHLARGGHRSGTPESFPVGCPMPKSAVSCHRPDMLRLRRIGIDTQQEAVIYLRRDSHVCRAEGLSSHAQVQVTHDGRTIVAMLHNVTSDILGRDEAGLSESAWRSLDAREGAEIRVGHAPPLESLRSVRAKAFGKHLDEPALHDIIRDIAAQRYGDVHLASFITACAGGNPDRQEMVGLTRAMIAAGDHLDWGRVPIVVAIVAACSLVIPKTSSPAFLYRWYFGAHSLKRLQRNILKFCGIGPI